MSTHRQVFPMLFRAVRKCHLGALACILICTLFYAFFVVKDFSGPLIGPDDTNAFEHIGFLVEQKLTWGIPPRISLHHTHETLYPFGTLVVFMSWGIERDLWYTLAHASRGDGPWIQLYQVASVFVSALGIYVLLQREHGALKALLVALAGTFMNFYAVYKFPHHLNVSVMHWAAISIVVDFVIVRRLVLRQPWSWRLVTARVVLVPLLFGLDLGYVAGYALLSLATSGVAVLVIVGVRKSRGAGAPLFVKRPLDEMRAHPLAFAVLSGMLLVGLGIYVPLAAQIVQATKAFHFDGPGGSFWAMQLRMLLPYLPLVAPSSAFALAIFGEAEGIGEFSTGWALLVIAGLGLRSARRDRALIIYVPMIAAFLLAFAYHPRQFPTLRMFPWFQFNRVAGRATLVFPLWFALAGLAWKPAFDVRQTRRWVWALGLLAAIETITAYATFRYRPYRTDSSFRAYMKTVRESAGEAVLDWPFCIAGGNGVATNDLCPYYALTATTYAYRRFHRKDVVGLYLGRMAMAQAQPFYDLGFPALFSPDSPEIRTARQQTRCFNEAEMTMFSKFFLEHDFAGVNLYVDLLPRDCLDGFYSRFGSPVAETRLPAEGRVVFLRPSRNQKELN